MVDEFYYIIIWKIQDWIIEVNYEQWIFNAHNEQTDVVPQLKQSTSDNVLRCQGIAIH